MSREAAVASAARTAAAPSARPRLDSVDLLRGLVMVVMAIDHTRDFFSNARFDPTDLTNTTAALFLTRWITHFCAPVFVFLAGTGAFLSMRRGKTRADLSRFLLTRGLWLVLVELTLVRFGWMFDWKYQISVFQVIWAIGASMVVLSGLVWLPTAAVTGIGLAMIALHNLLDPLKPEQFGSWSWLWKILHQPGALEPLPGRHLFVMYPLVPWIGVMAAGFGFGALFSRPERARRRIFLSLGLLLTAAFFAIRATNLYGDPHPWQHQKSALFTFFSWLNCEKYPPSLLYLLMTLGPAILLLSFLRDQSGPVGRKVVVYGRVPFFYYVLHIPLIHGMAVLFFYWKYGPVSLTYGFGNPPPPGFGLGLTGVYCFWAAAILILYFPCRWFAGLKQRNKSAWLSYL